MSTLKVNSIEPANAGSEDYYLPRVAAAVDGSSGTPIFTQDDGCSSMTDIAAGQYGFNFTNAMSGSGYFCIGCNSYGGVNHRRFLAGNYSGGNIDSDRTTTQAATGVRPEGSYVDGIAGLFASGSLA